MRTLVDEFTVTAVAAHLPADGETATVELGRSGPTGRGDHAVLPAFAADPRTDPRLPGHLRKRIDRFSALAYLTVAGALADLEPADRAAPERVGVFVANTRAGWSYGEPELARLVDAGPEAMHAYQATAWFPAAAQGEVTIALGLRGCAKTTAGRHSGLGEAFWLARDALERGAVDTAVVGVAESLVNGFVLRDWPGDAPLPTTGAAEGAVMFALTAATGRPAVRLRGLRHAPPAAGSDHDSAWVPTLAAARRLHAAVTAAGHPGAASVTVALGGGFWIDVDPSTTRQENP